MFEKITQRLERLHEDERGVSPVVGFVLIFALIMLVFTLYQADVVPAQNAEVEFKHSQEVAGDMEQLSAAVGSTGPDTVPQGVPVQLGVQYPDRALAINPGTPVGTIQTSETRTIEISGEDGSETLNTSFINYRPNYNRLNEETAYSIEHGMLIRDYSGPGDSRLDSSGVLFSGSDRIYLPLVTGDLQASEMSTVITPANVDNHTIDITSGDGELTLPTTLPEAGWDEILTDKSQVDGWMYSNSGSGVNQVTIELKNGTQLAVDKASVGDPDPDDDDLGLDPRITNASPTHPDVGSIQSNTELTAHTTDIFGSDLGDVDVEWSTNGSGGLSTASTTSNGNGNTTVSYNPNAGDIGSTVGVTASLPNVTGENSSVTFGLEYPERYIYRESPESPSVSVDEPETLAVSVQDEGDNPLSKVDVEASEDGAGSLNFTSSSTNESGETSFTYVPEDTDSGSTVTVEISLPNGSENGPVEYNLEFPSDEGPREGEKIDPGEVDGASLNTSAIARSRTHPSFKIGVPNDPDSDSGPNPIEITAFAIETKGALSGVTETERPHSDKTHNFFIYQTGLSKESETPLQLDGTVYNFTSEGAVTDSRVQLERFDSQGGVRLEGAVGSYSEADIVYWFILTDGTIRPVYFDATTGPPGRG
ncbi:Ig-like domain-containing protein [Halococcus agarilyticus]|uniref:Ig-like domain-containing protein n=1 Tax=Halococcus agarilyticus TaxID=1232219 RepID=UPI0006775C9B|nr:Ig-like domain-containing protein [Halococcus agarilyticus]